MCHHPFCGNSEVKSISESELRYVCHACNNWRIVGLINIRTNMDKLLAIDEFKEPCKGVNNG